MAAKFFYAILVTLFAVQNVSAIGTFGLPNVQDIVNKIKYDISNLTEKAAEAVHFGENTLKSIKDEAEAVISNATKDIETKMQDVISDIKNKATNGVKAGKCATTGISSTIKASGTGIKNVTACVTNQVNSTVTPMVDLITNAKKVLSVAPDLYKNLTSCFPNGFSAVSITEAFCLTTLIGPLLTGIGTSVNAITNDISALKSSVDNFRNAIVRCPRQRIGDLIAEFGHIVDAFGQCTNSAITGTTTNA